MPYMNVIPPGLDFSNLKVDLPEDPVVKEMLQHKPAYGGVTPKAASQDSPKSTGKGTPKAGESRHSKHGSVCHKVHCVQAINMRLRASAAELHLERMQATQDKSARSAIKSGHDAMQERVCMEDGGSHGRKILFSVLRLLMRVVLLLHVLSLLADFLFKPGKSLATCIPLLVTVTVCCLLLKTLRGKSQPSGRYAAAVKHNMQQRRQHMQCHAAASSMSHVVAAATVCYVTELLSLVTEV